MNAPERITDQLNPPSVADRRHFLLHSAVHEDLDELGTPVNAERRAETILTYASATLSYPDASRLYGDLTSHAQEWRALRDRTPAARDLIPAENLAEDGFDRACELMKATKFQDCLEVLSQLVPPVAGDWLDEPVEKRDVFEELVLES